MHLPAIRNVAEQTIRGASLVLAKQADRLTPVNVEKMILTEDDRNLIALHLQGYLVGRAHLQRLEEIGATMAAQTPDVITFEVDETTV